MERRHHIELATIFAFAVNTSSRFPDFSSRAQISWNPTFRTHSNPNPVKICYIFLNTGPYIGQILEPKIPFQTLLYVLSGAHDMGCWCCVKVKRWCLRTGRGRGGGWCSTLRRSVSGEKQNGNRDTWVIFGIH